MIEINREPSRRQLRQFAGLWFPAFCALVGWLLYYRWELHAPALAVWVAGASTSAIGLLAPRFMRLVFLGLAYATYPIGWVVSHAVLLLLYYGLITASGVLLRLFGKDPLLKGFDRQARSYWRAREPIDDLERYFRQY